MLRSNIDRATFVVPICEKWMLSSFSCAWKSLQLGEMSATFKRYVVVVDSGTLAGGAWYARRPVTLALYQDNAAGTVDVTDVHLIGPDGGDLLSNGDFRQGIAHWHFSTDNHLPWHIKNLAVQILFDQGWSGIMAWAAIIIFALVRSGLASLRGDLFGTAVVSALIGFLVVGVFDSLIDSPRLFFVFCIILCATGWPETREVPRLVEPDFRAS